MTAADPILAAVSARLERAARARRHKARMAGMDADDLFQAGMAAVLEILPARDPAMSDEQAANWLTIRAVGAMADEMRLRGTYKRGHLRRVIDGEACRVYSLSARVYACPDARRDAVVMDRVADPTAPDPTAGHDPDDEWRAAVRRLFGGCDPTERRVIDGYYRDGRLLREIGADLGLCESRVSQIRTGLIDRAREAAGVGS